MNLIKKSVEMIARFDEAGNSRPVRFKLSNEDQEHQIIQIERILSREVDQSGGNKMLKYTCEACWAGTRKQFELRYELDTCKWFLYKM